MRVITGTCRGRRLMEPQGRDVRPTTDQVKEAMFNIVQFLVEGARVLDLFAGSRDSIRLVEENLRRCELTGRVLMCDSLSFLRTGEKFDLIFLDPPYGQGLDAKAMEGIKEFDILSKGGIMICETRADVQLPEIPAEYGTVRTYRYGKIKLTVVTRSED